MSNIYKPLISLILPLLFLTSCGVKNISTDKDGEEKQRYFLGNIEINHYHSYADNTDPICQTYVDALNKYGVIEDFFKAPIHPNSPEFGYPKWEKMEIYEYINIYLKMNGNYTNLKDYIQKRDKIKSMLGISYENDKTLQLYYARADINNNGKLDDIIRKDYDRYHKDTIYRSYLRIFDGESEKSFENENKSLSDLFSFSGIFGHSIYSLFFYKGDTYIKQISYSLPEDRLGSLSILKIYGKYWLIPLCNIYDDPKANKNAFYPDKGIEEYETVEEDMHEKPYRFTNQFFIIANKTTVWEHKSDMNTDPICQELLDALNKYDITINFSEEDPLHLNSPAFDYPKWEKLDIYKHKDVYIMSRNNIDREYYLQHKDELEKGHMMEDNSSEYDKSDKRWWYQMYYTRADINNDGKLDDIIRLDNSRYMTGKSYKYNSHLAIFYGKSKKLFQDIDIDLSKYFINNTIYDILFYKGETYIRKTLYDLVEHGFSKMEIKKFNNKQELELLCQIGNY